MSSFGDNVRWLRTSRGLTQAELATRVHKQGHATFSASHICCLETGSRDPSLGVIRAVARALKVKPWYLLADLTDNLEFWEGYLRLPPQGKRDVQRTIKYTLERRGL